MQKLIIDMDNTIVNTTKAIVSLYNEDFKYYKDFHPVNWWEIDKWDFEECTCASFEQINTYFNTERFFERLEFMPGFKDWINYELQRGKYDIEILTMCYAPNEVGKRIWLYDNLAGIKFTSVDMKEYKDKSHIDMSDAIFVDDNVGNLITSNAFKKICFGEIHSWNKDWDGQRYRSWIDPFPFG